jgi:AraC-like DNA-binding protein
MQRPARVEGGGSDSVNWESVTSPPRAGLHSAVRQYSEFRESSDGPIDRSESANIDPVLIVEFEDPLLVSEAADRENPRKWQSFAAGASQAPTATLHAGTQHCVEVRFTPLGLYRLAGLPMHELTDRVVSLEDLFGRTGRDLPERLAAESDWRGRFSLLDSLFARAAADGPEPDNEVVHAWNRLCQTEGTAVIGAILSEIDWSRGRLAQRFREQVGLTPKAAARVLRFQRAARLLIEPGHRSLTSIALSCDYYDQAHFNRDFSVFAGCSPTEWIAATYEEMPGTRVQPAE